MPELPDIAAYIGALESRIVNQPLVRIRLASAFLLRTSQPPLASVEGRTVRELRRIGKRIAVGVEGDLWLVLHLMIAGRLHWRALDAKLATFGGAARGGGRGGGGGGGGRGGGGNAPGGVTPFNALNATFNTVLAPLSQDGIDMPPSKAQIDTWEAGCRAYTATVNAWKAMLDKSFFVFNSKLTKSNLPPLKIPATVSAPASCTFAGSK